MRSKQRSRIKKWIAFSIVILVVAGGISSFLMRPVSITNYESVDAKIVDISTYSLFSGNVGTKNRQTLISEKVTKVSKIIVNVGDVVKVGAVLIKTTAGDDIKSQISGEVVSIHVEENEQITVGEILLNIVDYNNLQINVKIDEYDIADLEEGKEVTVKIGAINKEITANISSISREGQIERDVAFFTVTLDIVNDGSIKIGMSAEVKLIQEEVTGVVSLPMTAIQFEDNNQPYVYKKDENNTVVKTEIVTGINNGRIVEVKSGVLNGETVLFPKVSPRGLRFLTDLF